METKVTASIKGTDIVNKDVNDTSDVEIKTTQGENSKVLYETFAKK